jgi:general nucleoside transport system permease protein
MFKLEKRAGSSRVMAAIAPLSAALLTVVGGAILFSSLGHNSVDAFRAFFVTPVSDLYGIGELSLKMAPILLCALGLAIGFRGNVWNIGAEGQLIVGAICGGGFALALGKIDGLWVIPAILLTGAIGGMAWASIAAVLRTRFNVNEILVTLMLTYIAGLLLSYLVYGPWRSPTGFNWPVSSDLAASARLPRLIPGTRLNLGIVMSIVFTGCAWLFLARSHLSYRMEVVGLAPRAARYAGFDEHKLVWTSLLIGGAAAGLAGAIEVSGTIGKLREVVSPGYGFAAIIVAYIGRLHPVGIFFASILMALFYVGGEQIKVTLGVPSAITGIFQGMLLFSLLMSDVLINYRLRWYHNRPIATKGNTHAVS